MLRGIVVVGPCRGYVMTTGGDYFERVRLVCRPLKSPYRPVSFSEVESNKSEFDTLYVEHYLVCMRGDVGYYAPVGMQPFDIITQLIEQ